jgi:hypothetical protein
MELLSATWLGHPAPVSAAGSLRDDSDAIDAQPLIREYFSAQLHRDQPEAFRASHSRLFDYLCETTKPHRPDGLDGISPPCPRPLDRSAATDACRVGDAGSAEGLEERRLSCQQPERVGGDAGPVAGRRDRRPPVDHPRRPERRCVPSDGTSHHGDGCLAPVRPAGCGRRPLRRAQRMQQEMRPQFDLLYSLWGFRYCDWLLAPAEQAAWQHFLNLPISDPISQISDCLAEVERRASATFNWMSDEPNAPILTLAADHLTLARVGLVRAILDADPKSGTGIGVGEAATLPPSRELWDYLARQEPRPPEIPFVGYVLTGWKPVLRTRSRCSTCRTSPPPSTASALQVDGPDSPRIARCITLPLHPLPRLPPPPRRTGRC